LKMYTKTKCCNPNCDAVIETIAAGRGGRRKYCADCAREQRNRLKREAARKRYNPKPPGFKLIHDPCSAPLTVGALFTRDEVKYGEKFGSFVAGTVFEDTKTGDRLTI